MSHRKLPVYLVIDVSESMAGPAIEIVKLSVIKLVTELKQDPHALETAYLGVITFAREACQVLPLTEISDVEVPEFKVRTGTSLGKALHLLNNCLKSEVVKTTAHQKGDYKPLVFLLTDGQPTDNWREGVAVLAESKSFSPNITCIGCGPDADVEILRQISDSVLLITEPSETSLSKFFVWLTESIKSSSYSIHQNQEGKTNLDNLPQGIEIPIHGGYHSNIPMQVFLHAKCSRLKQPYLMRFGYFAPGGFYNPLAAHPLEEFEESDSDLLPGISSELLNGVPPCPYCENPGAVVCSCNTIFCAKIEPEEFVICPSCEHTLRDSGDSTPFTINQSQG
jgi:uncharacterized protein YegL